MINSSYSNNPAQYRYQTPRNNSGKVTLLIIIFGIIAIGATFLFAKNMISKNQTNNPLTSAQANNQTQADSGQSPAKVPQPTPTLAPLDANSNLTAELEKNTPPDYSQDFENLKKSVSAK